MSEEKIIQHSEHALHILSDKKTGWKKKLKDIIQEIIIIVFAVTITLALHNWNDHRKERKMEKEFLTGIRGDLKLEKENLEEGIKFFQPTMDYYDTVLSQILDNRINTAYIDTNSGYLLNTVYFIFDNGRFEGFKSSGYLRLIENQELQKNLITLYTTSMPFEQDADRNVFRTREQDYNTYIGMRAPFDKEGQHVSKIIGQPEFRYQVVRYHSYFKERKSHKQGLIAHIDSIIKDIDKELNEF
jgi:hypothetical protein